MRGVVGERAGAVAGKVDEEGDVGQQEAQRERAPAKAGFRVHDGRRDEDHESLQAQQRAYPAGDFVVHPNLTFSFGPALPARSTKIKRSTTKTRRTRRKVRSM